jgi:transglutaminase-like putative cysteine protease
VARADLDDEFDEADFVDEFGGEKPSTPWHNSTLAVVGASAAGIAVIGVLVGAVIFMSGGDEPADAPLNFVDPSFSETAAEPASSATTTTPTITSTPQISTTEINGPPGPSTTSGSSDTSSSGSESSSSPTFTRPRPREFDENPGGPTSRRPRFNITRTLGPGPLG